MNCPRCANPTAEGDVFCGKCGTNLVEALATCSQCGKVNEPDSRFCTSCGTPVGEAVTDAVGGAAADETAAAMLPPLPPEIPLGAPAPPGQEPVPPPPPAGATIQVVPEMGAPPPPAPPPPIPQPPPVSPPAETVTYPTQQVPGQFPSPPPQPGIPIAAPPAAAQPGSAATIKVTRPISLVGAALAAVGAFLGWISFGGTVNGFDVPVNFLIDYQTTSDHVLTVGLVVLVLALFGALLTALPNLAGKLHMVRPLGIVLIVIGAVFLFQLFRLADDVGLSLGDVYAFGPIVVGVGGVLMLIGK